MMRLYRYSLPFLYFVLCVGGALFGYGVLGAGGSLALGALGIILASAVETIAEDHNWVEATLFLLLPLLVALAFAGTLLGVWSLLP